MSRPLAHASGGRSKLDELAQLKGQFGPGPARQAVALLKHFEVARLRDPADLIRLHETVLYLRAYPQNPRVLRLSDRILFSFHDRLRGLDLAPFEAPEISGIAGSGLSTNFSYDVAKSLVARHGNAVRIDWDSYTNPERLGPVLARLLPLAAEDWTVEPHPDWQRWLDSARIGIAWLLDRVPLDVYDFLDIPLRWELGDSSAARSRTRLFPGDAQLRKIFYHRGPFLRRSDVSLQAEFSAPRIPASRIPPTRAQRLVDLILDTSAARYRELWGFSHPDPHHVYHADFGRGVDVFFFGIPAPWRLPLRAYHAGMFFKNEVPIGYVEGLSLFEHMEVGFNLYYTFRDGETAWLYARLLKLFREQFGVTCFSVDPYQLGHDNEEAIDSGAFWFYRKLGFQPGSKEVANLVAREEEKISARPRIGSGANEYRTPPATLRRLASAPLIYSSTEGSDGKEWARFDIRKVGYRVGLHGKQPWTSDPEIVRAKRGAEEVRYLHVLQKNAKLRRMILRLGS